MKILGRLEEERELKANSEQVGVMQLAPSLEEGRAKYGHWSKYRKRLRKQPSERSRIHSEIYNDSVQVGWLGHRRLVKR